MGGHSKKIDEIDVTICTLQSSHKLKECLDSILREIPIHKIIVVDGGSTDGTFEILKEYPQVELYIRPDLNLGQSRELSFSKVTTEWFVEIDSDVVLQKGWFREMVKDFKRSPPVLKMEGQKVVLCQPFYKIKGKEAPSGASKKGSEVVMGVDEGLKHFAVLSVRDESINKEVARYFLDQRAIFDMEFNKSNGKFKFHNKFRKEFPANIKWRLINLRKEARDVQSQLSELQNKFPYKRFYHYEKMLSNIWTKIKNIHSEIVNQLTHKIVSIAEYHGVSTIKFEDLSWVKHSKRIEVGQFLAWNQVLMFHSQVQSHAAQYAAREGIKVVLVDAKDTSKICSKCRQTRTDYQDKEGAQRIGKRFVCTHHSHHPLQFDADLNAARNIALSDPIETVS